MITVNFTCMPTVNSIVHLAYVHLSKFWLQMTLCTVDSGCTMANCMPRLLMHAAENCRTAFSAYDISYAAQESHSPLSSLSDKENYMQERMSDLFLETGYENIYLAIGVAATALFVIETLVRVYRIYEDNNRRRKRKRSARNFLPEEMDDLTKQVITTILDSYDHYQ